MRNYCTTDSHRFLQKMQKTIKKIYVIYAICGCHGDESIFAVGRDTQALFSSFKCAAT